MVTLDERLHQAREAMQAVNEPAPPLLGGPVRPSGGGRLVAIAASLVIITAGVTATALLATRHDSTTGDVATIPDTVMDSMTPSSSASTPTPTSIAASTAPPTEPPLFERIPTDQVTALIGPLQINPGAARTTVAASEGQTLTIDSSDGTLCLDWTLPPMEMPMIAIGCDTYTGITAFVNERFNSATLLVAPFDITILAPDNIQLAVLNKDGRTACDLAPTPIPDIGAITVWICTGTSAAQAWDLQFTKNDTAIVADFPHTIGPPFAGPLPAIGDRIPDAEPVVADWVRSISSDRPVTPSECPRLTPVGRDGIVIGYVHDALCSHPPAPGPIIIYDAHDNPIGTFINGDPVLNTDNA